MSAEWHRYTQEEVRNAVEVIRNAEPNLFAVLVESEIQDDVEMREWGRLLINALNRHGFGRGHIETIMLAADCRTDIIQRYVLDEGITPANNLRHEIEMMRMAGIELPPPKKEPPKKDR